MPWQRQLVLSGVGVLGLIAILYPDERGSHSEWVDLENIWFGGLVGQLYLMTICTALWQRPLLSRLPAGVGIASLMGLALAGTIHRHSTLAFAEITAFLLSWLVMFLCLTTLLTVASRRCRRGACRV